MKRFPLRTLSLLLALPLLAGCNPGGFFVMENRQEIPLLKAPLRLAEQPRQFVSHDPRMTVQGSITNVCVVLATDVAVDLQVEKLLKERLDGAQLKAVLKMDDGTEQVLNAQHGGWRLFGRGMGDKQLYACAKPNCDARLAVGAKVAGMGLSATKPLNVLGVYWESAGKWWESGLVKPAGC